MKGEKYGGWKTNAGTHSRLGDCVVVRYGEMECWIPWRKARRLATRMLKLAELAERDEFMAKRERR
jgi:hypothetical protein